MENNEPKIEGKTKIRQRQKSFQDLIKGLKGSFEKLRNNLDNFLNQCKRLLGSEIVNDIENHVNTAKNEINEVLNTCESAEKVYPYLSDIEKVFTGSIRKEISKSSATGNIITFILAATGIVATFIFGRAYKEKGDAVYKKAEQTITMSEGTSKSIAWMNNDEIADAFGPASELEELKAILAEKLPYECRQEMQRLRELSQDVTNTRGFDENEIELIKAALCYCNRNYNCAENKLKSINSHSLLKDKNWLLALTYSESGRKDMLSEVGNITAGTSWIGINDSTISNTYILINKNAYSQMKAQTKICIYDASAGVGSKPRIDQGDKVKAILQHIGWLNCIVYEFNYSKRRSLLPHGLQIGLQSQIFITSNIRIKSELLADIQLIPKFGSEIQKNINSSSALLGFLSEECSSNVIIIVGTEFGGTSPSIIDLNNFKIRIKDKK